ITGRTVNADGEETGLVKSEILTISQIELIDEVSTRIIFSQNLENRYKRHTAILNGNVAKAIAVSTIKDEVVGSGTPSEPTQIFTLKQKPLAYISTPTWNGAKSTLEVRVDNILWKEVPSLYMINPHDQSYVVRIDEDEETGLNSVDGNNNSNNNNPHLGQA